MPTVEKVSRTDAGLASELRMSVMRLRRRLANERDPANDLSIPVMAVLGALFRHGELTVGELASIERVQPPTMTKIVGKLEERGLVVRTPHPTDRRQVILSATERGRAVYAQFEKARNEWLALQLAELTPDERDTLERAAQILRQVARN